MLRMYQLAGLSGSEWVTQSPRLIRSFRICYHPGPDGQITSVHEENTWIQSGACPTACAHREPVYRSLSKNLKQFLESSF